MALIPTKITARIDYWESKGLSKMRSKKTKTYKETVQKLKYLVDGKYMFEGEKHTMIDWRRSVDCFASMALNPKFLPYKKTNLKRTTLSQFLFNPFGTGEYCCHYKHCLNNPPVPVKFNVKINYPDIYTHLTNAYIKSLNNGIKTVDDLSGRDQANLGWTANKIGSFCRDRMGKLNSMMGGSQKKVVNAFIKASKSFVNHDLTKFDTNLLTRKWVWEKFPNYLQNNGYLAEEQQFSIYTWKG